VNELFQFESPAAISDDANFKIMTVGLQGFAGLEKHRYYLFQEPSDLLRQCAVFAMASIDLESTVGL
jgi:hypothetical protein